MVSQKKNGNAQDSLSARIADLEKRLSLLESKRLVAGEHVRLTQVSDRELLIESDADEDLSAKLESLLEDAERNSTLQENGLLMNEYGVNIHTDSNGTRVERYLPAPEDEYVFAEKTEEVEFPFRVSIEGTAHGIGETTNIVVCGGDNGTDSLVFAGTHECFWMPVYRFSVSSACYVILRLTSQTSGSSSVISAQISVGNSLTASSGEYLVPIAKIRYVNGLATVYQMHFGNVFVAGRII